MEELPCLLHTHVCVHTEILLRDHTNIYFQDCCHAYLKTRAAELAAEHYSLLRRQLPPNPTAQLLFKEWGLVQADLPSLLSNTQVRFKKGQTLNYNKYLSWADYSIAVFTQPFEKNLLKLTFLIPCQILWWSQQAENHNRALFCICSVVWGFSLYALFKAHCFSAPSAWPVKMLLIFLAEQASSPCFQFP